MLSSPAVAIVSPTVAVASPGRNNGVETPSCLRSQWSKLPFAAVAITWPKLPGSRTPLCDLQVAESSKCHKSCSGAKTLVAVEASFRSPGGEHPAAVLCYGAESSSCGRTQCWENTMLNAQPAAVGEFKTFYGATSSSGLRNSSVQRFSEQWLNFKL